MYISNVIKITIVTSSYLTNDPEILLWAKKDGSATCEDYSQEKAKYFHKNQSAKKSEIACVI